MLYRENGKILATGEKSIYGVPVKDFPQIQYKNYHGTNCLSCGKKIETERWEGFEGYLKDNDAELRSMQKKQSIYDFFWEIVNSYFPIICPHCNNKQMTTGDFGLVVVT